MPEFSQIYRLMLDLARTLADRQIDHALIGGMALAPRGFPRGTKDVDFLIREKSVPQLRAIMAERGATTIIEDEEFSSYFDGKVRVDFQHARRDITQAMMQRAELVQFPDGVIPVLQAEDIIGLKVQAYHNNPVRLQDRVDIQQLIDANWGKLDMQRIRSYFALFRRENELDNILTLVAAGRE
jgi:hypothetical protein